jgi:hypothetical protein
MRGVCGRNRRYGFATVRDSDRPLVEPSPVMLPAAGRSQIHWVMHLPLPSDLTTDQYAHQSGQKHPNDKRQQSSIWQ